MAGFGLFAVITRLALITAPDGVVEEEKTLLTIVFVCLISVLGKLKLKNEGL